MSVIFARMFAVLALSAVSAAFAAPHDMSVHHEMSAAGVYQSQGVVKKVAVGTVSIAHHPVPALNWPAMTMTFRLPSDGDLPPLKAGDKVDFSFSQQADGYSVVSVTPTK
ncbi:MAG TPA: copper-binding protein [Buttiauxella sp.]|jgi:Cu(I)/Ag(I) efflux system protein CusF